ncbi:MAG: hypothetical protein NC548_58065 [Lachnospiraceae bacterium]|nr:hypothetical protein [Lachnospiraceae bacterium]
MKHEKEWYTCDRCGCVIGDRFDIPTGAGFIKTFYKIFCKPAELATITEEKGAYITDSKLVTPDVVGLDIIEYYNENRQTIHLCGKCRKEFERFMRNES